MSTLNVSNITDGTDTVGTSYVVNGSAKAYSTQQGDGTLLGGLNITSVTDLGTGSNQVNITNSFANPTYAVLATGTTNSTATIAMFQTILVGSFKITTRNADKTGVDAATRSACFGDLA
jgi:hypothetical protein